MNFRLSCGHGFICLTAMLALAPSAPAITPGFSGYFRARGQLFKDRDVDTKQDPSTTAFIDQRLKLDADFALSDEVKAAAQFDVLDNLVWGFNGPALLDLADLARTDEFDREAELDDAIFVRRLYGEVVTPLGILTVGRQPVHWGLGVFYNDGNCLNCDFGDTQDRAFFSTRVGPVVVTPFLGKVIEGRVETRGTSGTFEESLPDGSPGSLRELPKVDADAGDIGVAVMYGPGRSCAQRSRPMQDGAAHPTDCDPNDYEVGLLWVNRFQKAEPLSGRITILDAYGKTRLPFVYTEAEVVFLDGRAGNAAPPPEAGRTSITQLGATAMAYLDQPYLHFGLHTGFGSGPGRDEFDPADPDQLSGTDQKEFKFDPDYDVSLLLFEEVVNSRRVRDSFRQIGGGRVRNAAFFKAFWFGDWNFAVPRASILYAFASRSVNGKRDWGWEVDLESTFRIRGGFEALAQFGLLLPGGAAREFLGSSRASPAVTVQLGTLFKF